MPLRSEFWEIIPFFKPNQNIRFTQPYFMIFFSFLFFYNLYCFFIFYLFYIRMQLGINVWLLWMSTIGNGNKVWEMVSCPSNCKPIGDKWNLKVKRKANGFIEKHKARLAKKRLYMERRYRIWGDFLTNFEFHFHSLLLALMTHLDFELFQIGVKTTFSSAELDEMF